VGPARKRALLKHFGSPDAVLAATREESFLGHAHRHPTLLRYRHHADAEGRLVKVEAQLLMDAGPYADDSAQALAAAVAFACGPYVVPNAVVDGWAVRTNNPPAGHVRGEGALQVCAAYEGQMDKLAAQLGMDPVELRARNVLATGDTLPTGQSVTCPAPVAELLAAVRAEPLPPLPKDVPAEEWLLPGGPEGAGEPGATRRGVGYALGMVHMLGAEGADEVSTATVKVEGTVATVLCAAVETGQGFTTLARQIVQDVLGVEDVRVASVDTDQPPAGPGCRGRHTWVSGGAVERAAKMVRTQLLQPLAANLGLTAELLTIADGRITSYDGVLSTTVAEALEGKELWATAQCRPHPTEPLNDSGQGDAFVSLAFAAVRAVVDVDAELGTVRVVRTSATKTANQPHIAYSSHMWPKYPSEASLTGRSANTRHACRGSKLARGNPNGPSRPAVAASRPPARVSSDVAAMTVRQSRPPRALIRCGAAEPTVSAPTMTPRAVPRLTRNHVAMSFMAGG
jgi:CO/xanthine dehydrogenase Mo-binding subunit